MIAHIYSSDFIPPFCGKTARRRIRSVKTRGQKGVYIIRERGEIVYIGMSQSCVTEAMYRHFYPYADYHRHPRTCYDAEGEYSVYILYCSREDAPKLERGLILSINPRDNRDKFARYLDQLTVNHIQEQVATSELEEAPF